MEPSPPTTAQEERRDSRGRRVAVRLLLAAACACGSLALIAGYADRAIVDSGQFADRATAAMRDDRVRPLIAERVTDELVLENAGDLIAARPLIESAVSSAIGGSAFTSLFRAAVGDVHRAVFRGDEDTVTLTLRDVGTVVAAGLEAVRPSLARRIDAGGRVEVVKRDLGAFAAGAARAADRVRFAAVLLAALAIAAAAGALAASADRRRSAIELGAGVAAAGLLLVVAWQVGRGVATSGAGTAEQRDAARAVWDAFLGDLRSWAWLFAGSGAIVAACAASLIRPVDFDEPLRRAGRWITTEPENRGARALRAGALVVSGLALLLEPATALHVLTRAAGLYLLFSATSVLLRLVQGAPAPGAAQAPGDTVRKQRRRGIVAGAVAAGLLAGAVTALLASGGATAPAPAGATVACNGHAALCERRLDEVALPATHNSMSAPLPGWYSSEQDGPIPEQLRAGVRGLLVDTHYADRLPDGRLRTDVGDPGELRRRAREDGVSPEAVDAALRLRARLGFSGKGERGMYLCHSFCELGGTPLAVVLRQLREFLVANPGEVVVVINQDYVAPRDFVAAVRKAGLAGLAYGGPTGAGRWPTLRQMVDSGRRVVFLAENDAGAAPWYRLAYESITEETPYAFSKPRQLIDPSRLAASCRPNRGPRAAPLFLVNHWVTTDPLPLPSQAAEVNAYGPLLRRLRECRRVRDHIPNLVAVNFYARGDLFRAVDALNGVR